MKIEYCSQLILPPTFNELKEGECFQLYGCLTPYMACSDKQAVNLETGYLVRLAGITAVKRINAKVVIS